MTDRPINKRNPAPKIWPKLEWKRSSYGTKSASLSIAERTAVPIEVCPESVRIGRYFASAHNGTPEDIIAAAFRCTAAMSSSRAYLVRQALVAARNAQ